MPTPTAELDAARFAGMVRSSATPAVYRFGNGAFSPVSRNLNRQQVQHLRRSAGVRVLPGEPNCISFIPLSAQYVTNAKSFGIRFESRLGRSGRPERVGVE